jgi:hypothetical protein
MGDLSVKHPKHPPRQRYGQPGGTLFRKPPGVPRAIPPFVMAIGNIQCGVKILNGREHLEGINRVFLHPAISRILIVFSLAPFKSGLWYKTHR